MEEVDKGRSLSDPWFLFTVAPITPFIMSITAAQGVLRYTRAIQTKFKVVAALKTMTAAAGASAAMIAYRNRSPEELETAAQITVGSCGVLLAILGLEEGMIASMHKRLGAKGNQSQMRQSQRLAMVYLGLAVVNQTVLFARVMPAGARRISEEQEA